MIARKLMSRPLALMVAFARRSLVAASTARRHTTVRLGMRLGMVFLTALSCAASLWGGVELCLERTSLVFGAPMGQPRGGRQLGTEAVWQVATE